MWLSTVHTTPKSNAVPDGFWLEVWTWLSWPLVQNFVLTLHFLSSTYFYSWNPARAKAAPRLTPGCWGKLCHCGRSWGWSGPCCVRWWSAWPAEGGWDSRVDSGTGRGRSPPRMACQTGLWSARGSDRGEKHRWENWFDWQDSLNLATFNIFFLLNFQKKNKTVF